MYYILYFLNIYNFVIIISIFPPKDKVQITFMHVCG